MKESKKIFKMTKRRRTALIGYSFLSVWIIGFLLFTLYPVILSGVISLSKMDMGIHGIKYDFVGTQLRISEGLTVFTAIIRVTRIYLLCDTNYRDYCSSFGIDVKGRI